MRKYYKCSDFVCFKYPKFKGKEGDKDYHVKLAEHARRNVTFKHKFVEVTFGKSWDFISLNYGCFTTEAIAEMLEVFFYIHYEFDQLMIPVTYTTLIDWVQWNLPKGSKQLKRFHVSYLRWHEEPKELFFTKQAREFSLEIASRNEAFAKAGFGQGELNFEELKARKNTFL